MNQETLKRYLPLVTALAAALLTLLASRGCDGSTGRVGASTAAIAPSLPAPSAGEIARRETVWKDSVRAVLYAEVCAVIDSTAEALPIRVRVDSFLVRDAVADSVLTDSLRRLRDSARMAMTIARRAQAELAALRGQPDVIAVLDDTLAIPDAESVFTAHAEYSYRDAAYRNVQLSHSWIEQHKTVWDYMVAYAPYAAGILALVKTLVDAFSTKP